MVRLLGTETGEDRRSLTRRADAAALGVHWGDLLTTLRLQVSGRLKQPAS
jgi:hypothetical protein